MNIFWAFDFSSELISQCFFIFSIKSFLLFAFIRNFLLSDIILSIPSNAISVPIIGVPNANASITFTFTPAPEKEEL